MTEPKKTTPMYSLLVATAVGVAGGSVGTAAFTVKAGQPQPMAMEYKQEVPTSTLAGMTVGQLANQGCSKIDTDNGLTGADVCTIVDLYKIYVIPNYQGDPDNTLVQIGAKMAGTWSPGAPE